MSAHVHTIAQAPKHAQRHEAVDDDARLDGIRATLAKSRNLVSEARLLDRALTSKTVGQRIHWLRQAADVLPRAVAGLSPCAPNCNHCCHQAVLVSESEARQIAREAKLQFGPLPKNIVDVAGSGADLQEATSRFVELYTGVACPFLVEGRCGIYRMRPLACRLHFSLAANSTPCDTRMGLAHAPYLDVTQHRLAYVIAHGAGRYADLREWFGAAGSNTPSDL